MGQSRDVMTGNGFAVGVAHSDAHLVTSGWGHSMTYLNIPGFTLPDRPAVYAADRSGRAVASTDGSFAMSTLGGVGVGGVLRGGGSTANLYIKATGVATRTNVPQWQLIDVTETSYIKVVQEKTGISASTYSETLTVPLPATDGAYRPEVDFMDSSGYRHTVYANPVFIDK